MFSLHPKQEVYSSERLPSFFAAELKHPLSDQPLQQLSLFDGTENEIQLKVQHIPRNLEETYNLAVAICLNNTQKSKGNFQFVHSYLPSEISLERYRVAQKIFAGVANNPTLDETLKEAALDWIILIEDKLKVFNACLKELTTKSSHPDDYQRLVERVVEENKEMDSATYFRSLELKRQEKEKAEKNIDRETEIFEQVLFSRTNHLKQFAPLVHKTTNLFFQYKLAQYHKEEKRKNAEEQYEKAKIEFEKAQIEFDRETKNSKPIP